MLGIRDRGTRAHLVANILVPVVVAGVTDSLLRALGWNQRAGEIWPDFAPRGATIGIIWVILFGCMGVARWRLAGDSAARSVTLLIALCLAYPFYTHFIPGHATELAGNIVTFGVALGIVVRQWKRSTLAATLIALVTAWIVFATVLVVALVQLNGWQT